METSTGTGSHRVPVLKRSVLKVKKGWGEGGTGRRWGKWADLGRGRIAGTTM